MNKRSKARLAGSIRLVPDVDTIGIPIFDAPGSNALYLPEMDEEFRITRFIDFYNEESYDLTYELRREDHRFFSIGEPTPLPFWHGGRCSIIEGDSYPDVAEAIPGYQNSLVLHDLARLLRQARGGHFRQRLEKWATRDMMARFHDVFYEPPVRSRYWVSRFRVAVANARAQTKPPHPIDKRLRRVALEWMRRFATKTDLRSMRAMLGEREDGVFANAQRRDMMYGFLIHKLATGKFHEIASEVNTPWLNGMFTDGLSSHVIHSNVPFNYQYLSNVASVFRSTFWEMVQRDEFRIAAKLAFLLYGRTRIPHQAEDLVWISFNDEASRLTTMMEDVQSALDQLRRVSRGGPSSSGWSGHSELLQLEEEVERLATQVLAQYDRVRDLDGILHGQDRLARDVVEGRHGMTRYRYQQLRKAAAGEFYEL